MSRLADFWWAVLLVGAGVIAGVFGVDCGRRRIASLLTDQSSRRKVAFGLLTVVIGLTSYGSSFADSGKRPPASAWHVAETPSHELLIEHDLKPGSSFAECEGCPKLIVIPSGNFTRGPQPSPDGHENWTFSKAWQTLPSRPATINKSF